MDSKTRVKNAFRAMKDFGISADRLKPVLKDVVKVYGKNWSIIEADNYRVLFDAIFGSDAAELGIKVEEDEDGVDEEETEADNYRVLIDAIFDSDAAELGIKVEEDEVDEEETEALGRPLKRLRMKYRGQSSPLQMCSNGKTQTRHVWPTEEPGELPEPLYPKLNGLRATKFDPVAINTMAEPMVDTNPSLGKRQIEQKSSTTELTENNDKAMTEDEQLLEGPLEVFCPDFSKTIASLNAKHGPIDQDCSLSSNLMKKLSLSGICRTLKQLEKKKLDELDISSLSPYCDIVQDAEKLNFNVKWLRERLDDIRVAVVARHEAKRLEATKNEHLVETKQMEAKLWSLQVQVKQVEDQLNVKKLDIEDLNGEINNETAKFKHFETAPLLDGLI